MTDNAEILQNIQRIKLPGPQFELVTTERQFPAMVAGFGSGKTNALIVRAMMLKFAYPLLNVAYYLPTYDMARTIAFPRFEEWLSERNIPYKINTSLTPKVMIENAGSVILRTMDNPGRIIGYEVADSLVDEIDTMKPADAKLAWQKLVARNRQKKPDGKKNTIAVGTTPEGYGFVYETWEKKPPSPEYYIIKASTYSNKHNLPDDYIDTLRDLYPSNLLAAYIDGEFVNLKQGSVYPEFNRTLNGSTETIQPNEPLHIGMDFNVTNMTAVVFVQRAGWPHAVNELTKLYDTPAMIAAIKARFPSHAIYVYPDASGQARKSNNASISDISLLEQAGFTVLHNNVNPAVKDRVLAVNSLIYADGKRRLHVNTDLCPAFTDALEKQAYDDKGEPDKTSGFDHAADAGGYFVSYRFPIVRQQFSTGQVTGA